MLVEQDGALSEQLKKTQDQLKAHGMQVVRGDGVSAIRQAASGSLQLVFIDPPFDAPLFEPAIAASARPLAPEGFVYLEAPVKWTDVQLAPLGLMVHRYLKAGAVHAHLLVHLAPAA
jgi:16S rRNA G966 N2-methylase RsmD